MTIFKLKNSKIQFDKNLITVKGSLGSIKYKLPKDILLLKKNTIYIKKNKYFFFHNLIKLLLNSVNYG